MVGSSGLPFSHSFFCTFSEMSTTPKTSIYSQQADDSWLVSPAQIPLPHSRLTYLIAHEIYLPIRLRHFKFNMSKGEYSPSLTISRIYILSSTHCLTKWHLPSPLGSSQKAASHPGLVSSLDFVKPISTKSYPFNILNISPIHSLFSFSTALI